MKDKSPVTWFETRKDPSGIRFVKWGLAIFLAFFLNWFYINGLPANQSMKKIVEAENEETYLEIEVAEAEDLPRYVEVNPDNPVNEPDDTNQISDKSAQAAQEHVAGPDKNPTPFIEGEDEESPKIIEGHIPTEGVNGEQTPESQGQNPQQQSQDAEPQEQQEESPDQQEMKPQPESMPSIQAPFSQEELPAIAPPPPTPEFIDEVKSDDPDGVDLKIIEKPDFETDEYSNQPGQDRLINVNIPPSVAEVLSKAVEEQKALRQQQVQEKVLGEKTQAQQPQPQMKPSPMPRPRLSPKVLPGPLLSSQTYAARMGAIDYDAKFSQFGHYLSRMFDTIQMQWYSLLNDVTISQEKRPAVVVVEYELDKDGRVLDVNVLSTNAGDLETILCRDAIESRAPFGLWTQQMVDQLGEQQTITLRFIYL